MVSHAPMFVDLDSSGNGMSALDGRRALGGLFGTSVRPLASLPSATLSSSNMQVTVAQNVWQVGDINDSAATFIGALDAFTVTPAAGPASGSRIDSIVLKPDNPKNSGDTDPYLTPSLIAGTTSPPTIAAPYYEIARITVPAGASTASACSVQFMQPVAAMPIVQQAAGATSIPNGTVIGQRAVVAGVEYRWNGTAWKAWDSDWTAYNPALTNQTGTVSARWRYRGGKVLAEVSVTFTAAPAAGWFLFALPVTAEDTGTSPGNRVIGVARGGSSSTQYQFLIRLNTTATAGLEFTSSTPVLTHATNTAPYSWASGDGYAAAVEYNPA